MQKFFCRNQQETFQPGRKVPDFGKNGVYQPAEGHFPGQAAYRQAKGIAGAQVAAAHRQRQIQPRPAQPHQKNEVTEQGMLWPQGTQKAIEHPQAHTQQAARAEPLQGQRRWNHPNRRLNQPPCRASS